MKKFFPLWILLVLVLAGCASGGRPDWADSGKSETYPENRYLTGMGTGSKINTAKERARADLAKVFSYKIDKVARDVRHHVKKGGSEGYINEARVKRIIGDRAEQVLTGTKVVETWQGPETKAYYAFAVLPRVQATDNLKQEIVRLDSATGTYVKRVSSEVDTLRKVHAASTALDAQVARLAYQRTLRTIDKNEKGVPQRWDFTRLSRSLEQVLLRVRIEPQVLDDTTGRLSTSTRSALSMSGFQVTDSDSAEFVLDAHLELENIGFRDRWHWSRGVLQITLKEKASGRERGNVRWAMKAAGKSAVDAEQQIAAKVDSLLKRQLRDTIIKFATH